MQSFFRSALPQPYQFAVFHQPKCSVLRRGNAIVRRNSCSYFAIAKSVLVYMSLLIHQPLKDMYCEVVLHATAACLTRVKDIAAGIIPL
jgi:hypothetical protein